MKTTIRHLPLHSELHDEASGIANVNARLRCKAIAASLRLLMAMLAIIAAGAAVVATGFIIGQVIAAKF